MMRRTSFFAAVVIALIAPPAFAQAPPAGTPTPIRGTVEKLVGHSLTVKARDGSTLTVALAPAFTVRAVVPKTLADIKAGDVVASTSVKGADGTLRALELHILPQGLGRIRLGQSPWDLVPNSLMTNAKVAQITTAPQGNVLKVTYDGKESEIIVPPGIPIVSYVIADISLLRPGAAVFVFARKQPDGSLTSSVVYAEKDGVKPPM